MKAVFEDYFRELIGDNADAFFDAIKAKKTRRALRANSLKSSKDEVAKWLTDSGYEVTDSPFSSDGIEITGRGERLSLKLPYYAGFTYPQDPSSMFAIDVLDPQPGENVIDMTAAPGGKTTHIAQRMKNTGVLLANDLDKKRLKALHSNLERLGVWNAVVTRLPAHKLSLFYPEKFDRVLLDPSCSGEGLLVTRDGKESFWNRKGLKRYANDQFSLLCSAFRLLKPGGRLVYSTCTLNDVENDGVVQKLIDRFEEAEIVDVKVNGAPEQISGLKGFRFWPQKTQTKGFFCIAITKTASVEFSTEENDLKNNRLKVLKDRSAKNHINILDKAFGIGDLLDDAVFTVRDGHVFRVSPDMIGFPLPPYYFLSFPFLKLHSGSSHPTHVGALWLALYASKGIHELNQEDTLAFFERRPISYSGEERGLFLAKYKNFPLGIAMLGENSIDINMPKQF
ncbi:RsmB/NOP family class I SAM-dependent RNA methyltransferase [Candidatus Peregrinibacteria bacterium]|jgi:NOL1/NOP2/sun family putative RNA methylase|nr:RsmB/NOP family class I SAM-dependent RNA methyltransferase [Candidatus Peregrinibacteria bacterium]MBT4631364.1 RsmB/NOP family class I SAM-dependent RNA methyltransferase [Candidatus Peregrinibacteria bacterium]MBT5517179.1 RsmB/NOP family class I SAM-dependent RNA methyltransferase [Candidatus Peregrinibacteria bacterium]MBT5823761.1 RsmB/NOP family class I SAM-dependent RNA methyltransferase [Candidatus Peregrinibacteria bacterium]